jgi:hypothetical protein
MELTIRSWDRRALALMLVVLVAAIGFCVFDGDGHHENDHAGFDLCFGMLAVSMALTMVSRPALSGRASTERLADTLDLSLLVPAPPPKFTLL